MSEPDDVYFKHGMVCWWENWAFDLVGYGMKIRVGFTNGDQGNGEHGPAKRLVEVQEL